jgi:predicted adenine nucleotide alpha hydrolase (AANH) superfamily ATPase
MKLRVRGWYNIFMKLLMHLCCGNCTLYPLKHFEKKNIRIRGLWFNPNIHPEEEYRKRLDAVKTLETRWDLDVEYAGHFAMEPFLEKIASHDGVRCEACYAVRLDETARTAKKMGCDGFTTSLLVSPFQEFSLLIKTGKALERKHAIRFHDEDLRSGWAEGRAMSREMGLYRQYYCGCILSKRERDGERNARRHTRIREGRRLKGSHAGRA